MCYRRERTYNKLVTWNLKLHRRRKSKSSFQLEWREMSRKMGKVLIHGRHCTGWSVSYIKSLCCHQIESWCFSMRSLYCDGTFFLMSTKASNHPNGSPCIASPPALPAVHRRHSIGRVSVRVRGAQRVLNVAAAAAVVVVVRRSDWRDDRPTDCVACDRRSSAIISGHETRETDEGKAIVIVHKTWNLLNEQRDVRARANPWLALF